MSVAEPQLHPSSGLKRQPTKSNPGNLAFQPPEEGLHDIKFVERNYSHGGYFRAAYNRGLPGTILSGAFRFVDSMGTEILYEGSFIGGPHKTPEPHGDGIRKEGYGTYSETVYTGQWKDGKEHGLGEWRDPSRGESYLGEWRDGMRHGFGRAKFSTGDEYEGDWEAGRFHNRGKYLYCNGDSFVGLWNRGVKVEGTLYFLDGRVSRRAYRAGALATVQDFDPLRQLFLPALRREEVHTAPLRRFAGSGDWRPLSRALNESRADAYPILAGVDLPLDRGGPLGRTPEPGRGGGDLSARDALPPRPHTALG
jgi:hypothetical protein